MENSSDTEDTLSCGARHPRTKNRGVLLAVLQDYPKKGALKKHVCVATGSVASFLLPGFGTNPPCEDRHPLKGPSLSSGFGLSSFGSLSSWRGFDRYAPSERCMPQGRLTWSPGALPRPGPFVGTLKAKSTRRLQIMSRDTGMVRGPKIRVIWKALVIPWNYSAKN